MDRARKIITDVIGAMVLARRLKFEPLLHNLLESSEGALGEALSSLDREEERRATIYQHTAASPPPPPPLTSLPPSPPESVDDGTTVSNKRSTRYTEYSTALWPYLRRLYPDRPHKENVAEAAKLWKEHRYLDDLEQIIKSAQEQAAAEAPPTKSFTLNA
jgi:hypothetical protein